MTSSRRIDDVSELQQHLQAAVALELSTIPVYLSGLWTIKDQTNECAGFIQKVTFAEMRHMCVAANCLIATGGRPDIIAAARLCQYPCRLPDGETEFEVSLLPFGPSFLQQAMQIEKPATTSEVDANVRARVARTGRVARPAGRRMLAMGEVYLTIGEFYEAIIGGIDSLVAKLGEAAVFPNGGSVSKQISSLGATAISGSAAAKTQLTNIIEEGEGASHGLFDETGKNLAHFYVFQQMDKERAYQVGDQRDHPTGAKIDVPKPDAVFQAMLNPKVARYPAGSQVAADATAFLDKYTALIKALHDTFTTNADALDEATDDMDALPALAAKIYGDTIPNGPGVVPGPTFEIKL